MQISDSLSTTEDYKIINKANELLFGIYIIKRGDLLDTNVFKIGKTKRSLNTRHNEYSVPNTIVLYYIAVNKVDAIEHNYDIYKLIEYTNNNHIPTSKLLNNKIKINNNSDIYLHNNIDNNSDNKINIKNSETKELSKCKRCGKSFHFDYL